MMLLNILCRIHFSSHLWEIEAAYKKYSLALTLKLNFPLFGGKIKTFFSSMNEMMINWLTLDRNNIAQKLVCLISGGEK